MRVSRRVLDILKESGVDRIFGIPAGSVNAIFDDLNDVPGLHPIVVKHEGAAGYMAAAYAKATGRLAVCIGSSGPGATNLLSGAANAMREQQPVLFLTGHVPVPTQGRNSSQELHVAPLFADVTKWSGLARGVDEVEDLLDLAIATAQSGVPGPVHLALPIDVQLSQVRAVATTPRRRPAVQMGLARNWEQALHVLEDAQEGLLFVGQGARGAREAVVDLAQRLGWPIACSAQAKGMFADDTPNFLGVYGFAGDEACMSYIRSRASGVLFVIGSSLGETATSNYDASLAGERTVIHLDRDASVFGRTYRCDVALLGDADVTVRALLERVTERPRADAVGWPQHSRTPLPLEFGTRDVLLQLQRLLPEHARYTVDIGEFMSWAIHDMPVVQPDSYEINVHFGPMGIGIAAALGWAFGDPQRPVVSLTGDGCFFMHGMEVLTAREHDLDVLFVVFNNARLSMVHQGHRLQYGRAHACFSQRPVDISQLAATMGVASRRVATAADLLSEDLHEFVRGAGTRVLEVALVDTNPPPMGDRVKFLSSFGAD
ncbi:MAG: thiamine pyrophosphate-binding protein [Firmicutes bacterium]|nr:thiamine pyrophosphate-binding protein [Bacillota bacterium]